MQCPRCGTRLVAADRQGVEIDHCPCCRGVWLDRGELDKLVDRSREKQYDDDIADYEQPPGRSSDGYQPYGHKPRDRDSFWSSIFDF